jgi:hypothetical protein
MKKSIKKLLVTLMPWKSFQIHTWHALEVHWHPCRFGWILLEVNGFTPMACGTHIRKWLFCPFTCPGSSSTSGLLRGGGVHLARAARRGRRWRRGGRLLQRKEPCGSSASTCRSAGSARRRQGTRLTHWPASDRAAAPVSLMQVGEAER